MRLKFVAPLMPTLVEQPPQGDGWIHEVKFDGYRSQLIIDEDGTRIYTRNGHDWTAKYRDLVQEANSLGAEGAIVDGELAGQQRLGHGRAVEAFHHEVGAGRVKDLGYGLAELTDVRHDLGLFGRVEAAAVAAQNAAIVEREHVRLTTGGERLRGVRGRVGHPRDGSARGPG